MSFHREAMQMGRAALNASAARLVVLIPASGANALRSDDVEVRHTAAEDTLIETNDGPAMRRQVQVCITIGSGTPTVTRVDKGAILMLDVDGTGEPEAWTVDSIAHSDVSGAADALTGFRRVLCVQHKLVTSRFGSPAPR